MSMKNIVVIGSLNMDQVTRVHKTPKVGETVSGNGLHYNPGGKGANQAVALGKLSANVTMIGKVGNDSFGHQLKTNLSEMNVKDQVKVSEDASTGLAIIMVNDNADNSIVVIEGANGELKPEEVNTGWFNEMEYVVVQLEIPIETVFEVLKQAKQLGKTTFLNPAPAKTLSHELLILVDYLVVNETEFEQISGIEFQVPQDLIEGYKKIGVKNIILTLGTKGAWFYDGNDMFHTPAKVVKAIDTTAAGDSFIGGFIYELSKGSTVEQAMSFATEVAAFTVTKLGAQSALPFLSDLSRGQKL